jgi:hypothetical protein
MGSDAKSPQHGQHSERRQAELMENAQAPCSQKVWDLRDGQSVLHSANAPTNDSATLKPMASLPPEAFGNIFTS